MELPFALRSPIVILITLSLILLSLIPLYNPLVRYSSFSNTQTATPTPLIHHDDDNLMPTKDNLNCDIYTGEWVPNPEAPYYQNDTCWAIHEHQNCMKYGRPDSEFMKWRWKPNGCDLPIFNPYQFLELMRNKSMAFVGDSVGRNQMQSLICLLSRVEYPKEYTVGVSNTSDWNINDNLRRWHYVSYNFTIAMFWSPYLVKSNEEDPDGPTHDGIFNVYLDEFDDNWTTKVEDFDYLILSSGHWFWRATRYYEKSILVGCRKCEQANVTILPLYYGYRWAFKTAFKAINNLENFKGVVILRTFAPKHFEGGEWNTGGNCIRTKPFKSSELKLDWETSEVHTIQLDEFRKAEREGRRKGTRFVLMDITKAMSLRPDGHPSRYGHLPKAKVVLYNDCVHWCLPGPIDTWADFLVHIIKNEEQEIS